MVRVRDGLKAMVRTVSDAVRPRTAAGAPRARPCRLMEEESAQGTTEYAILVGVLVVIAIIAIVAFRDKVSELWQAIASGINSL